ncbi:hypothetical protein HK096_002365 [Nowakowskiella sp. JEL0078]|nr:hypothetical protein HK096_002365 [Nowakowskiella sp. JEL0078]
MPQQHRYVAISHQWGPPEIRATYEVLGTEATLSSAGKAALLERIQREHECPLWFDVISVNQAKREELQYMMKHMDEVYWEADVTAVIVAGSTLEALHLLVTQAQKICLEIGRDVHADRYRLHDIRNIKEIRKQLEDLVDRTLEVCSRDTYFTRVWTLQEIMLSTNVIFYGEGVDFNLPRSEIKKAVNNAESILLEVYLPRRGDFKMCSYCGYRKFDDHKCPSIHHIVMLLGLDSEDTEERPVISWHAMSVTNRSCEMPYDYIFGTYKLLFPDLILIYDPEHPEVAYGALQARLYQSGSVLCVAKGGMDKDCWRFTPFSEISWATLFNPVLGTGGKEENPPLADLTYNYNDGVLSASGCRMHSFPIHDHRPALVEGLLHVLPFARRYRVPILGNAGTWEVKASYEHAQALAMRLVAEVFRSDHDWASEVSPGLEDTEGQAALLKYFLHLLNVDEDEVRDQAGFEDWKDRLSYFAARVFEEYNEAYTTTLQEAQNIADGDCRVVCLPEANLVVQFKSSVGDDVWFMGVSHRSALAIKDNYTPPVKSIVMRVTLRPWDIASIECPRETIRLGPL